MKVIDIRILDDLEQIDIENDNIDVFVDTDDGYTYTLSLATPKNLQFLMKYEEQVATFLSGYPFIIVNKLTWEIIERAVKAFAEQDGGYWLKIYHFGGYHGTIDKSIFDQLKAKHFKEQRESAKYIKVDLMREIRSTLKNLVNKTDLIYLVEQYRSGNTDPAIKIRAIPGTCLTELRVRSGARIYFQEKNNKIEVVAISDKDNQKRVIDSLADVYPEKNNV